MIADCSLPRVARLTLSFGRFLRFERSAAIEVDLHPQNLAASDRYARTRAPLRLATSAVGDFLTCLLLIAQVELSSLPLSAAVIGPTSLTGKGGPEL